jgi:DNA-binding Lrp family transcriptional regulator
VPDPGDSRVQPGELERRLIVATQAGLPLSARPYHVLAEAIGSTAADVQQCLLKMMQSGIIRRIGAVPNHYAIGYRANGMTVWDVSDDQIDELGDRVGALDFVSHCYRRPRQLPDWPYNLFAMVHAASRDEVETKAGKISALLGTACSARDILYSTRLLKKTGLRISP